MKTFKDLDFKERDDGLSGTYAQITFDNGYGASVLLGDAFYSNGVDTYELAVLNNGNLDYSTSITTDVLGGQTEQEVNEALKQIQLLEQP